MNCDLITQWCVFCDFPLFREHLTKYRNKYKKIIVYPSRHHGIIDLEKFLKEAFPETWVTPIAIDYGKEDWRQAETMPCLEYSNAEWIRFAEADFFVKDWDKFYADIEKAMQTSDMIGWWNPTHFPYIHPSCLFIKREILEKTHKDFSAHPEINGGDHFSMLTKDVLDIGGKITILQDLGYEDFKNACHLGGLTYVYQNFKGDETIFGVKNPEMFYTYNYWMRQANVPQNDPFMDLSQRVEKILHNRLLNMHPETNIWKKFFII